MTDAANEWKKVIYTKSNNVVPLHDNQRLKPTISHLLTSISAKTFKKITEKESMKCLCAIFSDGSVTE